MGEETSPGGELVRWVKDGHVGRIILNRPEKRNAMNLAVWEALDKAVAAAAADPEVRAVILTGAGKSFCAGIDLGPENELVSAIGQTPGAVQKLNFFQKIKEIQNIHNRLERLPQPTIAAAHSHCLGAGLELILCCDIRLCTLDAVFGLPEATLAIITDVGGLQRLPRVVGRGHAREIAFRGHRFEADRARAIQLVNAVYADQEELEAKAVEMAQEMASNPPLAVQGAKEVFLFDDGADIKRSLHYTAARSCMILPSQDMFEAMSAHMQKRKGDFKGA
ncbi:MAG: enoyl-CoA hydratase/isomerase family protein [Deltaproteobacteria bacterium]|nr:enoyl-CoA hydratase/isomerase family protein [Deltaproteobacteria bacterium]